MRALLAPLPIPPRRAWSAALAQAVRTGARELGRQRLRAALTVVGLVIAIAGVLLIDVSGQVTAALAQEQLTQFGASLITLRSDDASGNATAVLKAPDLQAVRRLPNVVAASSQVGGPVRVTSGNQTLKSDLWGVTPEMQTVLNLAVSSGSFFSAADEQSGAAVLVIGRTLARQLFPGGDALGRQVRLNNVEFRVVGVLQWAENNGGVNLHDISYAPASTAGQRLFGSGGAFPQILLTADSTAHVRDVAAAAQTLLEQRHQLPAGRGGITVRDALQGIQSMQRVGRTLQEGFGAIALLALAMGLLGLASVMQLAVRQRTREIGLRLAVGAQRSDLLLQFLAEAATLALVGGLIGITVGYALSLAITHAILPGQIPPGSTLRLTWLPSPGSVALALILTLLTGLLAGLQPARRAAWLEPMRALRQV